MPLPPNRVDYSPIIDRPPIKWPDGARVALWIAPNVEHYEYEPEYNGDRNPWPRTPYPDVQQFSYRDYGNRVGFWRMLEVLDKHNIRCCVSLNMAVLEHYPEIGEAMVERNWDFMSHGIYNTRYLNTLTEEEEREFYARRANPTWLEDLRPLATDDSKPFLEIAPWLIVVFKLMKDDNPETKSDQVYYVNESVGIACGIFIAAAHHAGLATLTHTPSPMKFLGKILNRPDHERPYLLIPVGYTAEGCTVPDIHRKTLEQIMVVDG